MKSFFFSIIVRFRLERLEHLAEKFRRKCALHEEWAAGKEDALRSNDWRSCGLYKIKVGNP